MTVDILEDITDAGDGEATLREAIAAATSGDTIDFDAGLQGGILALTQGEFAFSKNLITDGDVSGDTVADMTIDARGNSQADALFCWSLV